MGEYGREQRHQLSRAVANSETGSRQLKGFVDHRIAIQCLLAGSYSETDKSDAHHMPSARALAAIVKAGIANKTGNASTDIGSYGTLAVNNIYRGASAVKMPHEKHVQTRTYGSKSSSALSTDIGIITSTSSSDTIFNQIQQSDIINYNGIMGDDAYNVSADSNFQVASDNTKANIGTAIEENKEVEASRDTSRVEVIDIWEKLSFIVKEAKSHGASITLIANNIGISKTNLYDIINSFNNGITHREVNNETAAKINTFFDSCITE